MAPEVGRAVLAERPHALACLVGLQEQPEPAERQRPMPAMCSVSALNDCLRNRSAVGDSASMSSAQARTSRVARSAGTTRSRAPSARPVAAS